MKIRNPITGEIENTLEAKLAPSKEVKIISKPKGKGKNEKKHDGSVESLLKSKKKYSSKVKPPVVNKYMSKPAMITVDKKLKVPSKRNKGKPLDLEKYKYTTEWLQDVDKEKKGIPTRGRLPQLERSLVTKKRGGKVKGYKKGGPITYRMTGGQVVGNSYD